MDMRLPRGIVCGDPQGDAVARVPEFSYAVQPIVDIVARKVYSYEALIRGRANEPALRIFERVPAHAKYQFDQDSRMAAIALAAQLGLNSRLNLNFLPQGLCASDAAVASTLAAASRHGLTIDRVILEVTEGEVIADYAHLGRQLNKFRGMGLKVAIDDFGAGYSGLNMLADFQPDQIKIDMNLVRGIERNGPRQSIVRALLQVCGELGIDVIAEGVESPEEYTWFAERGVRLFQGYYSQSRGSRVCRKRSFQNAIEANCRRAPGGSTGPAKCALQHRAVAPPSTASCDLLSSDCYPDCARGSSTAAFGLRIQPVYATHR
jgi:EAL domain-containing protein (putative c-di-GMP-specific phosphodiesterase class I)